MRKLSLLIILFNFFYAGHAQLVLVPAPKNQTERNTPNARAQSTDPLVLPFWDDFSTSRDGYADSKRWEYGKSVWVNNGMGINPPSLNVATLDGLDSLGKPYNVNDVLAKGYADKMVSAPLRSDLVTAGDRSRVFISFFYQYYGNGEAPDLGDVIQLLFKDNTGKWEVVWSKENDGTLVRDKFEQVTIPITAEKFFHDSFQFQIRNFARLSGPYDTWHVDYVYVSNGKQQSAPVRPLFPDRSIVTPITPIFSGYYAMPIKHFYTNSAGNSSKPTVLITNLRQDQVAGNGQPVSYSSAASISVSKKDQPTQIVNTLLDINQNIGSELNYNEKRRVTFNTTPNLDALDNTADSINIKLGIAFDTGDNKTKTATEGDYDFNVFNPIEFRHNDSISGRFVLASYYAYDDGSAEYGAGLNQPGAQLAYEFNMKTTEPDTIVAIDIYFPRFGDESSQIVEFQIRRDITDSPTDILYKLSIPIQRNTQNKFWRIRLADQPVGVKGKFYIGWKQNSSAVIAVGLDKNTDSSSKIFANINGAWEPNINVKGSLMIRPVFGKGNGSGEITGAGDLASKVVPFPNPCKGVFYLASAASVFELYTLTGQKVEVFSEHDGTQTRIDATHLSSGLYLLRVLQNNRWSTHKIVIDK